MNTSTDKYHYELPPRVTVLEILIYLGLSTWMVHLATKFAEGFYFQFITLSVLFVILTVYVLIRRFAFPCKLELTEDAILLPEGHLWPRIVTIRYADIISLRDCEDMLIAAIGRRTFWIGPIKFDGYPEVREIISVRTGIELGPFTRVIGPASINSDELPEPLVQWVCPAEWVRFRLRAALSKPILYQLRTELWFFVRCFAFCCVYLVIPILSLVMLPWLYKVGIDQLVNVSCALLLAAIVLAIMITMLHWLIGIDCVRRETEISFRDRGITKKLINGQRFHWDYREILCWSVIERPFKEHLLQIVLLKCQTGIEAIPFSDASIRDQVVRILHGRKVPEAANIKPPWEAECDASKATFTSSDESANR